MPMGDLEREKDGLQNHVFKVQDFSSDQWFDRKIKFSKSPRAEQSEGIFPFFLNVCVSICHFLSHPLSNRKKDTDLKFGIHNRLGIEFFFPFFRKSDPGAASIEKLPRHVDFP